jgi:stage V sporulation protein B
VRTAGRGVLSIASSKIYFIITSYAVQLALTRLLSEEEYGLYGSAMRLVSIVNNVLIVATVQSVSKLVSEDEDNAPGTLRRGLQIQLVTGAVLGALLFSTAPLIAERGLLDRELGPMLQLGAAVVLAYALYATLVGSINGRHLFPRQAGLDAVFSTLRTSAILGAAALGFGALGAFAGFATAAVCILLVALTVVGVGRAGPAPPLGRWLLFMGPLAVYHLCLNGTLMIDQPLLKRTVAELMREAGASPLEAARAASRQAGFYNAAQQFAFVPYQLILSLNFVVFPMISRATSAKDAETTKRTIRAAMRFSFLALLAVASPIGGASDGVMRIAYTSEYLAGAPALGVLVFGLVAFALFVISGTMLSGAGRPLLSTGIAAVGLVTVVGANRLFVSLAGVDGETLRAAALGTTAGMVTAMLIAASAVYFIFRAWLPVATLVRGLLAAGLGYGVAHAVPHGSAVTSLLALVLGGLAYLAALAITRELRRSDLDTLVGVVRRG